MSTVALVGARLVLPHAVLDDHALLIDSGRIARWMPVADLPRDAATTALDGGWLLPGFIDTQVNGGGDVLLNDAPSFEVLQVIASAHRRYGTTGMLPTLISDHAEVVAATLEATEQALDAGMPGILGAHIEGPHLSAGKKGIHDAGRFSVIDEAALARLTRPTRGRRIVTLAPELAPPGAIRTLTNAGILVAAAHSLADYDQTIAALAEGLAGFTHLFNAMTPMESRSPGMVGAALLDRASHFGLIVDGLHVHPATMQVAIAARGLDGAMLVTDAMPPVGGRKAKFTLFDREIQVIDGTCRGPDGTLAGSALSMAAAFRNAMAMLGCSIVEASRLASGNPARFLRLDHVTGAILPGLRADLVHLDDEQRVTATWIGGDLSKVGE